MSFSSPHLQHPKELAPGRDFAPALAIYHDKAATIVVSGTQIVITIGGDVVTVTYVGKNIEEICSEVSVATASVSANALNASHLLPADFLYYDGEQTADGGKVVRMRAHVVRYQEETRIRCLLPYSEHRLRPWYPRLDRGTVRVTRQGVDYLFGIPEYADQEWSTYFGSPFVDVTGERPIVVSEKVLRLARTPVFWYRHNIRLTVNGIPTGPTIIEDVDVHNGLVKITVPMSTESRSFVDYTYRENSLIYKGVNLNPSMDHNPVVIDHVVLLYVQSQADSLGRTRRTTVSHTMGKTMVGAISAVPQTGEPVLIVGAYQVRPTAVLEDLTIQDTRSPGGGILEEKTSEAITRNMEVQSYGDLGRYDGIAFPGAVAGVMRLERSLLDSMEERLVEQLIHKHVAAGGLIVLDPVDAL